MSSPLKPSSFQRVEVPGFHSRLASIRAAFNTLISFFVTRLLGLHTRLVGESIHLTQAQREHLKRSSPQDYSEIRSLAFGADRSMQVYPSTFRRRFDHQLKLTCADPARIHFARIQDQLISQLSLVGPAESYPCDLDERQAAIQRAKQLAEVAKDLHKGIERTLDLRGHWIEQPCASVGCVAIACGVKTLTGQHFVSLLIDFTKRTLEYYDPQGIDPKQRKLSSFPHVGTEEFLQALMSELGSDFTLKWQSGCHQYDTYNCVPYGTRFFEERMKGHSYEALMERWSEEAKGGLARQSITDYRGALCADAIATSSL